MKLPILLIFPLIFATSNAYKVLVLCPTNWNSHMYFLTAFVRALLNRGHEVTYLTNMSLNHPNKLHNYTEVLIDPPFKSVSEHETDPNFDHVKFVFKFRKAANEHLYENPNVQKFIKSTGHHFDVIVAEEYFSESLYMLTHKHKAPLVTVCPLGNAGYMDVRQGLLSPLSFVSFYSLKNSDKMSFMERWINVFQTLFVWIYGNFVHVSSEEQLAQKYFAHLAPLPPLRDILYNISINFVNTHRTFTPPWPAMPSIIPIGGAHIQPTKALPNDLKKFLDEAENGAIFFSLGSEMKSSKLPQKLIQIFLNTFKTLKQRVLWKIESLDDIPSNVMIRKSMPQNDILAHPNVVLFICHGGLFGIMESLYHGVPLLVIPFFGDHFRNGHRIEAVGYGKSINQQDLTEKTFSKAINEIVSDATYSNKVKEASAIFNDKLVHPMDEAMFWIEHVARFRGAKHLKSHAVNMSYFTYLSLDVMLVNSLAVAAIFFVLRSLIRKLFCKSKSKVERSLEKKRK